MNAIISGKVIKGKEKGKALGFPTANIKLKDKIESGVYAGMVNAEGKEYPAGVFVNLEEKLLEAHLIGFSGDLYEREIEIEIGEKMRDVIKFENDAELINQIKKDIAVICN